MDMQQSTGHGLSALPCGWRLNALMIVAALLLSPLTLQAQEQPKLGIAQVRVGFPVSVNQRPNDENMLFKAGAFAPVFVDVVAGKEGWKSDAKLQLTIETKDNNDDVTSYTIPVALPVLGPKQAVTIQTFTKPAMDAVTARLRSSDGVVNSTKHYEMPGRNSSDAIILLVGSDLAELRKALAAGQAAVQDEDGELINPGMPMRGASPEYVAVADNLEELPDQWFAYEGVDLVILTTAKRDFLLQLAGDARRRQALAQWVARGGHLVVSAGKNQDVVAGLAELEALLPMRLAGVAQQPELRLAALAPQNGILPGPVEIARLEPKPDRSAHVAIGNPPLVVQGMAGLGRVTLVGFDIDQNPFTRWQGRGEFLLSLLDQAYPRKLIMESSSHNNGNDQLTRLFDNLERFEEVPVISFGWVALFIFLYILIVGPIDYWFLKHVVKRLELTWITFPTAVILISGIAYFTAYQLKGKDLRLRKLDLVDIDLRGQQAYGRTWLTIFSPRIENYTIGLQPVAGERQAAGDSSVVLSWLGRPVQHMMFRDRGQSLFTRSYDYATNAIGLERVPIPVWTTKSFTAAWAQALAGDPLFAAELRQTQEKLTGTITWRPGGSAVNLDEAYLFYRGHVYPLQLPPGQAVPVQLEARVGGTAAVDWLPRQGHQLMPSILFFESFKGGDRTHNHGLRSLDQSWRLAHDPGEAVLLARLPVRQGPADDINLGGTTPARLWLGDLPAAKANPPSLVGVLRQETWVRVFIPIQDGK